MIRTRLKRSLFPVLFVSGLLYACSSDDASSAPTQEASGPALRGQVTSAAGGPVSGVTVTAGGQTATTDAQGRYTVNAAAGEVVVRFTKAGFVDGLERMTIGARVATQLDAVLLPTAAPVAIDAAAGGEVTTARGAKVLVPANALVDKNGVPVTGNVDVYLTPIDPSKEAEVRAAPGDFVATQTGNNTMLESYGMVDITIRKGEDKLQVAADKEIELRIPAPEGSANPPATMPLWSFDEAKGVWVQEGTVQLDPATRTYTGKAKHMSFWNADQPFTATCVCGKVYDKATGAPLAGARVVGNGTTYFGTSEGSTGDDGKFCLAVRKDSDVVVSAYHKTAGGQARNIKTGNADTSVPPTADDLRCVDIGRWDVEKDVFIKADGTAVGCGAVAPSFAGTCVQGLFTSLAACFQPSGECVIRSAGINATVTYGNGSRIESGPSGATYYGANGQVCGTTTIDSTEPVVGKYTLPSGESFTYEANANGSTIFRCANGETVVVTPEQQQQVDACTGNGESSSQSSTCRVEGLPDAGGGFGTTCTSDAQCGGSVCCDVSTTRVCLPREQCDQIRNGQ